MDWKTDINVADLVTFTTSAGRVYANYERPLTVTSPPFVTSFPKLTRAEVEKAQDKGLRVPNFETDITMKGAKEMQAKFKAFMDDLDGLLLAHIVTAECGTVTPQQAQFMLKSAFKTRRSIRTGKDYPEGMTCRSKMSIVDVANFPVVDGNNNPYTAVIEPNDIIRVQLTYRGPYHIRNSCFGNSWELTAVQFCGKHQEPAPLFLPVDSAEFPSLS
jgi:hypothetical protein